MSLITEEKVSRIVSENVDFKWTIENFFIDKLVESDEEFLVSPPFNYSNIDWYLKVSRNIQNIFLRLSCECPSKYLTGLTECVLSIYLSSGTESYYETYKAPIAMSQMKFDLSIETLETECVADNILRVGFELKKEKLIHEIKILPKVNITGNKTIFKKKGRIALAENIGSLLKDSRFSDVALKVGEETFQAHKAILASRSKVFDGMFQSGMKESKESLVEITEMKPAIVKDMLQYIYTGTTRELSMDAAIDLYVGSDRYDLQELKGWCKEFILKHISSHDVCRIAVIAHLHSDGELIMASKRTFRQNSKTILLSEPWREFGEKNPTLQTDYLESALLSDD